MSYQNIGSITHGGSFQRIQYNASVRKMSVDTSIWVTIRQKTRVNFYKMSARAVTLSRKYGLLCFSPANKLTDSSEMRSSDSDSKVCHFGFRLEREQTKT